MPQPPLYKPLGTPFNELESVDSTNNYALGQINAGLAPHGSAFFARQQWAGKGQRGKIWTAEPDSSLILSLVIDPLPLNLSQQFQLSACIALSVCEFFSKYAGTETKIKWPNDLYWQDRKAGGILIESIIGGNMGQEYPANGSNWKWAVAGIGININQPRFEPELRNPVSLRQITGKTYSCVQLARELCEIIDGRYRLLLQDGWEELYAAYLARLYKKDELVKLKKGSRQFEARIKTVTQQGKLLVEHGLEEEFDFGEIEWVLPIKPDFL